MLKCKICGKELIKKQKSTCSITCRNRYSSIANKGRVSPFKGMKNRYTEEQRKKISERQKGKKLTQEHKDKISQSNKGQVPWIKGKKHTKESRKKMSIKSKKSMSWLIAHKRNTIHGENKFGKTTSEYRCWVSIRQRCYNKNTIAYKNYGGRGIVVCDRWKKSFVNFLEDMGRKGSEELSIDRINNDGNYEPVNCRWATRKEQFENNRLKRLSNGKFN